MEKRPETAPETELTSTGKPPPFDPDPRLVTYLERGAKPDAEERFRQEAEKT